MEKNLRQKVNNHTSEFKNNLQQWIQNNNASIIVDGIEKTQDFITYLQDFPNLELDKNDFQKRKRIKNNVPDYNRCIALKCNGERCSRKQKHSDTQYCGTHIKGSPYGNIEQKTTEPKKEKIQIWLQEINGISRYIDDSNNVYCTQDILSKSSSTVTSPRIIGKYEVDDDGNYIFVQ